VTTCYDDSGRIAWVSASLTAANCQNPQGVQVQASNSYASSIGYAPQGAMTSLTYGNGLVEAAVYNNRLQLCGKSLGSPAGGLASCPAGVSAMSSSALWNLALGYNDSGASNNNGNLRNEQIGILESGQSISWTQVYGYDGVNRLITAAETLSPANSQTPPWSVTDSYDGFGNRAEALSGYTLGATSTPAAISQFNAATNRLSLQYDNTPMPADAYDAKGNLQDHPQVGQMAYDAENRMVQFTSGASVSTYVYDGDGRRVMQTAGGSATTYVYDGMGQLAAEYSTAATGDTGTTYLTGDHLGSTRVVTDATGAVLHRTDYFPFGEDLAGYAGLSSALHYAPTGGPTIKFTGKERDSETGLDYFGFRYFSSAQGRWTSPDQPFADQQSEDPQSWNMYAYVRNNPLKNTDPDGRDCTNGVSACLSYIWGGVKAVGNFPYVVMNAPTNAVNLIISPFTNYQIAPIPLPLQPANDEERQGMEAANGVMLVAPLASELGASNAVAPATSDVPLITQNAARGAASETRVLNDLGLPKNTEPVYGTEGKSIPDFQTSTTVGEIKDVNSLSDTKQLRIQRDAAGQSGRDHVVVTGTNTSVTPNVQKPPTKIIRRDDLGPQQ